MWKKCTPLWRKTCFQIKVLNALQVRNIFASWNAEKVHAVVVRRCAKHIWKSKRTRHIMFRKPLEVEMWRKCRPLWCKVHFEVKHVKNSWSRTSLGHSDVEKCALLCCEALHFCKPKLLKTAKFRSLLDVQMWKTITPLLREAHSQVNVIKAEGFGSFFEVQMSKKWTLTNANTSTHTATLYYNCSCI